MRRHTLRRTIPTVSVTTGAPLDSRGALNCLGHRHNTQPPSRQGSPGLPVYMGSPKSGARGALHARCSKLWGLFHIPSGMHTVLLLTTLAWLCYLGAWLLLDFSLRNRLQVSSPALLPCHINILCLRVPLHEQGHMLLARFLLTSCTFFCLLPILYVLKANKAVCVC